MALDAALWLGILVSVVYYDYDCIVSCISYYVIIMSSVSVCDFDLLRMRCFSCASCLVV